MMFCELNKAYSNGYLIDDGENDWNEGSKVQLVNRLDGSDVNFDNDSEEEFIKKTSSKKLTHKDCINRILKDFNGNMSSNKHAGEVYEHVRKCKYCKNNIKNIMKNKNKGNKENKKYDRAIDNINKRLNNINDPMVPKNNYTKEISICLSIIVAILIIANIFIYFRNKNLQS